MTSPAWRAASPSSSSRRSACWSGRRSPKRSKASTSRRARRLRKYGVRFGAYHIYLPILLKPAPRVAGDAALGAQARKPGRQGRRRSAASGGLRAHLDPRRQGHPEAALPHRRLSRLRRARGARRYSGAARRPHPPGAVLARGLGRAEAGRRGRWPRLYRHRGDDLADRRLGRGLCLDPALARLPHGPQAEAGGAAGSGRGSPCCGRDGSSRSCRRGNRGRSGRNARPHRGRAQFTFSAAGSRVHAGACGNCCT